MLPTLPQLLLLLLHASSLVVAQRRGGRWRGGGSGGGDGNDEEDEGGSIITPPPDTDDPIPECSMSRCACTMIDERTSQYELPGMYYNGTITVRHKLSDSSVWIFENPERKPSEDHKWCGNNDKEEKSYEYPALLFVGTKGNNSDTNPIFWILRGYQPANQTDDDEVYLDVRQRWIHLRSSDFVVKDESEEGERGQYRYFETDATVVYRETSVYWKTIITKHSEDDNSFSARATYDREPIFTEESGEIPAVDLTFWDEEEDHQETRTSQYVTLSDVCDVLHQTIEGASSAPRSRISEGDTDRLIGDATTPTIWLPLGTVAEMSGLGSATATFTLKQEDWDVVRPYTSGQSAACFLDDDHDKFEYSEFSHLHRYGESDSIWNLTLSMLELSFEGELVGENSTEILKFEDGVPVFGAEYERAPREEEVRPGSQDEEDGAMRTLGLPPLLGYLPLGVVVMGMVHALGRL